nr:hypothetical protein [Tanacetum cinerariifolium]
MPYVPEPVYPKYIPVEDGVFPAEEQPLPAAASATTDSSRYIPKSDPDEDPKDDDDEDPEEDPADYPADHDDEEEEPSRDDDDEDPEEDPADYPADHDDEEEEEEPSGDDADEEDEEQDKDDDDEEEEHSALADSIPPPPALHRLSIVHCSRYEAGKTSAAAAARLIEGRRADYGFVGSVEAEIRRWIAEDIGYGIRDTWIDPRDVAEEEALMTLEGVNTRVTELAAVQEQDTQDIYRVMEDAQGRQTEIFQRLEALDQRIDAHDTLIATLTTQLSSLQGHLMTALGEIQALQAREQARVGTPEGVGSST